MTEPISTPAGALASAAAPAVEIRPLRTSDELLACVDLQRATWGDGFADVVPASILKVSQRIGGVAAGAFDMEGRLLGFVFGLTGIEADRIVHWSDMLAVREEARDLGIGRMLKEYQRDAVRAVGGTVIFWTYDPLVARNAHLNFNRLGVSVVEYVDEMYGTSTSELHRGLGTDRLVVAWPVARDESEANALASRGLAYEKADAVRSAPILNPDLADGTVPDLSALEKARPPYARVAIPRDIFAVQSESLATAGRWRHSTRRAFHWALARGYAVRGVYEDERAGRSYYVLTADPVRAPER
jgi:predicted GNAT superfamily acetyltransferase